MNIEIADVNFALESLHEIELQELPSNYSTFLKKAISANEIVNVSLELNRFPDIRKLKKIFDTGHAWSMFADSDEYFVALNTAGPDKSIVWLARFKWDFVEAVIYCGEMFVIKKGGVTKIINPLSYPLDQILLMYYLSERKGALIHCAGLEYNGRGYIFPGKSGAGKSTISRQFAGLKGFDLLSDDRIAVRKMGSAFKAYGTPWAGEAGIAENKSLPLCGIFFIKHGEKDMINDLKPQEALKKLMPVTSIPWYDKKIMTEILLFCEDLVSAVPAYEIFFRPDIKVTDVFEEFISK